jgi:hypothetical protein
MRIGTGSVTIDTSPLAGIRNIIGALDRKLVTKDTAVELITEMVYGASQTVGVEKTNEGYRWTETCLSCEFFTGNNCCRAVCTYLEKYRHREQSQEYPLSQYIGNGDAMNLVVEHLIMEAYQLGRDDYANDRNRSRSHVICGTIDYYREVN